MEDDRRHDDTVWEQRWHPLREEWVIIAAHRNRRPWSGERTRVTGDTVPAYVSDCYLCPGNARVSGAKNEDYVGVYVFDNDHPCVGPDSPATRPHPHPLFQSRPADGVARVVCYTPLHNMTLAQMPLEGIVQLLRCWQEQFAELAARPEVNHVLIFENKGEVVGVSNPHPHCQIYATNFVFKTIANEVEVCERYWAEHHRALLADLITAELQDGRRVVAESNAALSFVPYFARYAYETYVAPKAAHPSIATLAPDEIIDLARVLQTTLIKFDNLWQMSFPYVLALHQAPTDGTVYKGFHFHMEFHPPLRGPDLLKYLAGPEIGGGSFLSDTCPEAKAAELRAQADVHYKDVQSQ